MEQIFRSAHTRGPVPATSHLAEVSVRKICSQEPVQRSVYTKRFGEQVAGTCPKNSDQFEFVLLVEGPYFSPACRFCGILWQMASSHEGMCLRDLVPGLVSSRADLYRVGRLAISLFLFVISRDNILQTISYVADSSLPLLVFYFNSLFSMSIFCSLLSGMSGVTGAALRETSHINKRWVLFQFSHFPKYSYFFKIFSLGAQVPFGWGPTLVDL